MASRVAIPPRYTTVLGQTLRASRVNQITPSLAFAQRSLPCQARRWVHDESSTTTNAVSNNTNGTAVESAPAGDAQLNPPPTTRPPPLTIPSREAAGSQIKYLFQLSKAYLGFLKNGVKNVNVNRKLLRAKYDRTPKDDRPSLLRPGVVPKTFSRADWLLMWRTRHDLIRIPAFGLLVMATGELSILIAAAVDGLVPYPCRIPSQAFHAQERAEARRKRCFDQLDAKAPEGALSANLPVSVARTHALRSMYISGDLWERLHFLPPGMWQIKGTLKMMFLEGDDQTIVRDGGVAGLIHEEVKLACMDRGINILGKSETDLRGKLGDWLRLTAAEDITERRKRITTLLLTRQENWPESRDFALPNWHL